MKKLLKSLLCVTLILSLTGCGEIPVNKKGEDAVVSFTNSELNISINDLYEKLKDTYGTSALIEMIDTKLLDEKYETDEVANKYVNSEVETYKIYYGGEQKFLEALQQSEYQNLDNFKKMILLNYKRELATKDYTRTLITDKEIETYYKDKIFGDITASHILIKLDNNDSLSSEEKAKQEDEAKTKIEEILKKLEDGEDFHDLAKEYSDDEATKKNGGSLGSFNKGEMESAFEEAAMKLEVGKYTTAAIKTSYGYHLILKEDEKEKPTLESVKEMIINNLIDNKMKNDNKMQYKALIKLREDNGVTFIDENMVSQYENAKNNWSYGDDE